MNGLNTVEARIWSEHLSKEIVVKLEVEDSFMLYNDEYVNELKRLILSKAMDMIEEELKITSITMTKVY